MIQAALERIPGRAIVNSINLEAGRDKLDVVVPLAKAHGAALIALTIDEVGMAKTRRAQARGGQADRGAGLRRARARPRGADLRRAHLHAHHRRRGVEAVRGRDDRGHQPDQGGAARREDLAGRLERLLRRLAEAPARSSTRSSSTTAWRPGSTSRWSTRTTSRPTPRSPTKERELRRRPRLQPPRGRARALHRPLRAAGRGGGGRRRRRPDRGHGARGGAPLPHPAPQEGGRGGLDRPLGREDRRRPDAEHTCCCPP